MFFPAKQSHIHKRRNGIPYEFPAVLAPVGTRPPWVPLPLTLAGSICSIQSVKASSLRSVWTGDVSVMEGGGHVPRERQTFLGLVRDPMTRRDLSTHGPSPRPSLSRLATLTSTLPSNLVPRTGDCPDVGGSSSNIHVVTLRSAVCVWVVNPRAQLSPGHEVPRTS